MPNWIGPWEIIIIVVIILVIFGGRLLPRLGRSLGGSVTGLRKGLKEGEEEFKTAIKDDETAEPETPAKAPVVDAAAKKTDKAEQA
jgi:sec-independent protein translocase protein TatA